MFARSTLLLFHLGIAVSLCTPLGAQSTFFRRGDSNTDGRIDVSDSIRSLLYLFRGVEVPCEDALDADDNGVIDTSDALFTVTFLFLAGDEPPAPGSICGSDPTDDPFDCLSYEPPDPALGCGVDPDPGPTLTLGLTLESESAASGLVGADGGVVTTTSTDGSEYVLEIPPGAVPPLDGEEAIEIRLIPIAATENLPFTNGLVAAVHLEPEGLQFLRPVTLTITPAGGFDADELTGFSYRGDGEDFHLYPIRSFASTSFTMDLVHFSGRGGGHATRSDRESQQRRQPSREADRTAQRASEVTTELERRRQTEPCLAPSQAEIDDLLRLLREWYNAEVKPLITEAKTNDGVLLDAIRLFLGWLGSVQLLNQQLYPEACFPDRQFELEEHLFDEISDAYECIEKGLKNAITEALERCVSNNDPHEVLHFLPWVSYSQALPDVEDLTDLAREYRKRCLRFELDFESTIKSQGENVEARVRAERIPLTLQFRNNAIFGSFEGLGDLKYVDFKFEVPSPRCSSVVTTTDSTLEVTFGDLDLAIRDGTRHQGLILYIAPGELSATVTLTCSPAPPLTIPFESFWTGAFSVLHENERDITDTFGGFGITGWSFPRTEDIYARKAYGPRVLAGLIETTELIMRHRPLPPDGG